MSIFTPRGAFIATLISTSMLLHSCKSSVKTTESEVPSALAEDAALKKEFDELVSIAEKGDFQLDQSTASILSRPRRGNFFNIKMKDSAVKATNIKSSRQSQRIRAAGGRVIKDLKSANMVNVEFPQANTDLHRSVIMQFLQKDPLIEYVEPDYIVKMVGRPNDPDFSQLWGLYNAKTGVDIKAIQAWEMTTGSKSVVVGVIDSGIDCTHPDLADNCWTNPGESGVDSKGRDKSTNKIDDDGNGYIDDVQGWNFLGGNNISMDDNSHGTHVAGTIGAVGNNATGVVGVNWQVSLVPLKFLDSNGVGSTSGAVEALDYATKMGFFLTSNSWGGNGFSFALASAVYRAQQAGIILVAAAGNEAADNDNLLTASFPASYSNPNVVSVAAVDENGNLASFSNWGAKAVHVAAPGVKIYSTIFNDNYKWYSGTSMATPHVSGVLALMKAHDPKLTTDQLIGRLTGSVAKRQSLTGRIKYEGIVDAAAAVAGDAPVPPMPTPGPPVIQGNTYIGNVPGDMVTTEIWGEHLAFYQWAVLPQNSDCRKDTRFKNFSRIDVKFMENVPGKALLCFKGVNSVGEIQFFPKSSPWNGGWLYGGWRVGITGDVPRAVDGRDFIDVKVEHQDAISYKYAVVQSKTTDCMSNVTFSETIPVSTPLRIDNTGSDGYRTLCLMGIDKNGWDHKVPTVIRWLTVRDAKTSSESFGFLNSSLPIDGQIKVSFFRVAKQKPGEGYALRLCKLEPSDASLKECQSHSSFFAPMIIQRQTTMTIGTTGDWVLFALPPAGRGVVEPFLFRLGDEPI